ncbi:MAG: exonuclease SbcCD subunit D C-terminal domain-containing protein [Saprospiraceae bacterium]
MRIIHTSDWHLGQRFLQNDRTEEQERALAALLEVIQRENADALIVSGDIFDIGNPPVPARRIYYHFLTSLLGTSCRYVVITGGNHDAPGMLDAPKSLLKHLNVFVTGAAPRQHADALIELRSGSGQLEAVVAAVPYLRERDLRASIPGESGPERLLRIREAIREYFTKVGESARAFEEANVPVICMAHLFAVGAQSSGEQNNIYIGDVENIEAGAFPEIFSYVALGHIHRPQIVGGVERVRYSGSLIPLSFSETKDVKGVYVLEYSGSALQNCRFVDFPVFRRLKTIEGTLDEVKQALEAFDTRHRNNDLRSWIEVIVHADRIHPGLDDELRDYCADFKLDLLKVRLQSPNPSVQRAATQESLKTLEPLEVFRRRLEVGGKLPEQFPELESTFRELLEWMKENDVEP